MTALFRQATFSLAASATDCFLGTQPSTTSNVFTLEVRLLQKPKTVEKTLKDGLGSLQSKPS